MAAFTSVPQTTSSQFRHYDPTLLKRTKSKAKANVTGNNLRRDHTEKATYSLGLLHQDTDLHAVPQQTLQFQPTGPIEGMDSTICDLLRAGHGKSMYDIASGDRHHQLGCELLDKGAMGYAIRVETSDSATKGLLDGSSQDFHLVDTVEERDSAADVQPSNKASSHQENNYDLIVGYKEDYVSQRCDLDAGINHAFSAGDMESSCHERLLVEDGTFFDIIGVTNRPSATSERSRHSSVVGATTINPAAATDVVVETEPEDAHSAKRQRLAERQPQSPILESVSTLKSTSLLNLSGQASRSIPSPQAAAHKDDGATHLVLPPSDLRDKEDDQGADVRGKVDELLQSRRSIFSFEGMEGEQDVILDADWRVMNRRGSGSKVGENFEEEPSHNEACNTPPSTLERRKRKAWAPETGRELSNTVLSPLDCSTVPTRARQQVRPRQPRQKQMLGRPRIDRGLRSCSPQSSSPDTTARDGTNINYRPSLNMSGEITDLTLCTIPNGSSIVAATVRYRDSNLSLDPVALGHKFFGKQGKVIRMTQLSPDSWMLLGYWFNDSVLSFCNRGGSNAEWMSSSHSDAASHGTDHSEDDWDEEGKNGDRGTEVYSQRTHKQWLESDEELLLSLKDKQGMEWKERQGQEEDPAELVEARNMALATQGFLASCTPTMAWNYHFGDMEAFYAKRFAQVDAQDALVEHDVRNDGVQPPFTRTRFWVSSIWG
ncbi:hypothetical protein EJ07DRAFT_152896 [Lizonia empirigonia]|nr:hypothetical protein EJ07DRAFT_152896 [Lizonia empirigonia]